LCCCRRAIGGERALETAYVSGVQAILRDHVAAVYEKTGVVKNGDRVEVLEHDRHFVKVRTATGAIGWVEQRNLVSQQIYDRIQKLTADNQKDPCRRRARPATTPTCTSNRDATPNISIRFPRREAVAVKAGTAEKPGALHRRRGGGDGYSTNDEKKPGTVTLSGKRRLVAGARLHNRWLVLDA